MNIMSLILPVDSVFRYLKNGRVGLGFIDGILCTKQQGGTAWGVQALTSTDVGTLAATGTISKRLTTFTGTTGAAVVVNLPAVDGDIREVILLNVSATSGSSVTLTGASATITGATAGLTTVTVTYGTKIRLLSNGTLWYVVG